jgi:hypothetical protein
MARAHPVAPIVVKLAYEKGFGIALRGRPWLRLLHKLPLDTLPGLLVDDCWVQAVVGLPLMAKPSDIDGVREDPVDVASTDQTAARRSTRSNNSNRQSHIFCIENGLQSHHAAKLKVALEEVSNEFRVLFHDVKRAVLHPISEWNRAAHPDAPIL